MRLGKIQINLILLSAFAIFASMKSWRIGHGYDVHRLAEGLTLRLGGVDVPYSLGCVAHSDGDAVIHALCDALLGAAALGDIGLHFPDTDAKFKGIDSTELLRRTAALVRAEGYEVGNVDCTIVLQVPKVRPYIESMRVALAEAMGVEVSAVSVKATTTEKLGFTGRSEGVEAHAVVLLYQK
jgi:2-C-methyl-D-erythritol 2,4-cyclodiphosphate synthase